jgi:hypothetical protein
MHAVDVGFSIKACLLDVIELERLEGGGGGGEQGNIQVFCD